MNKIYCVYCGMENKKPNEKCCKCNKKLNPKENLVVDYLLDHVKGDLEGNFEEEYLTESQMKSLEQLSVYLCLKYDIKDILPHRELGKTLCPGKNFPMEEIKTAVIEEIKSIKVNKSK